MKKLLIICTAASIFAACNNDQKTDLETTKDVVITDTSGMYNNNASTDVGNDAANQAHSATADIPPVTKRTQTRTTYVDRAPRTPVRSNTSQKSPQTQNTGTTANTGNTTTAGTGTTTTNPATTQKKEGWSNSTKGAVIGGVGGAIAGAVISKKKGKGAVVGGVLGAAGGYILGRKKDKNQAADTAR